MEIVPCISGTAAVTVEPPELSVQSAPDASSTQVVLGNNVLGSAFEYDKYTLPTG